jgi:DNA replication and repair protein RecF
MLLERIEVHNFRNLSGEVYWAKGLNILHGFNGQGKTAFLEAIYLLATTKSFHTNRLQEAIRFNEELAVVRGTVSQTENVRRELQVNLQGSTKSFLINGKREPLTRYLGELHTFTFTSSDLEVVRGGPEARRRFLDRCIASQHTGYLQTLADYNRVLKQKTRILSDAAQSARPLAEVKALISPWNEQLIKLSALIHHARFDYVARLSAVLVGRLFGESISIRYLSSFESHGDLSDYETVVAARLEHRLSAEIEAGYSLLGVHRDDLEILFDGRDIRTFGSSGQQRSALITLDLAAISVYHSVNGEYPVFLIDDLDAELDRRRINYLLEYLDGRTQTFVTTSNQGLVEEYSSKASLYEVSRGMVIGDLIPSKAGAS